jgi:hypothetical protein
MKIYNDKAYATEGINLRKIERVMRRLYDCKSVAPGEQRDLAQVLWLFLHQDIVDVTKEMGL